jgi:transposase
VTLLDQGHRVTDVARRIGCSHSSVIRWRDVVAEEGVAGLKAKPVPGCPAKLTERQRQRIPTLLVRGALAWGFRTDLWTTVPTENSVRAVAFEVGGVCLISSNSYAPHPGCCACRRSLLRPGTDRT